MIYTHGHILSGNIRLVSTIYISVLALNSLDFVLLELLFNSPECQFCKSKLILATPANLQLQVF